MAVTLDELVARASMDITVLNRGLTEVSTISNLDEAGPADLAYVLAAYPDGADATAAGAVVTNIEAETLRTYPNFEAVTWLLTEHPRLVIAQMSAAFARPHPAGIHPSAVVDAGAGLAEGVSVGAHASIGADVTIGAGTVIAEGARVMAGSTIGADCLIGPGAVVGHNAFVYQKTDDRWVTLHSLGSVVIGDRVEIGANVCVDRGNWGATRIDDDVKIDNLTHIGHDSHLESMSVVTAGCTLAGYVHLLPGAWLSPNTAVKARTTVGAGGFAGIGATVVKDIEPGSRVAAIPARPLPGNP